MDFIFNTFNSHFRSDIFWPALDCKKITGNLGISDGVEALFVMMLVFNWGLGITFGLKFCCDELEELESEEQTEIEKKISQKEETEIEK